MRASLALLATCPLAAHAVFRTVCQTFSFAYMDPIVTPGKAAGHEHSIGGTLGFADRTW
ncbi:unnamed protein product, partial [Phaeothamnion confervicola]